MTSGTKVSIRIRRDWYSSMTILMSSLFWNVSMEIWDRVCRCFKYVYKYRSGTGFAGALDTCINTCICTCVYTCIYVYIRVYTCIYVYMHMDVYAYLCMYGKICCLMRIWGRVCRCFIYVFVHMYVYVQHCYTYVCMQDDYIGICRMCSLTIECVLLDRYM